MADNIQVTQGSGTTMATDDVAGVQFPRVKVSVGADGSATDVSSSNPMPTVDSATNASLSSIDGKLPVLSGGRVPVDIGGSGSITVTSGTITVANTVEITNDVGAPIPVSGTVTANTGLSQPLTDSQLRASAVPVSVSGVATSSLQTTGNNSLSSIDSKLPSLSGGRVPVDVGGATVNITGPVTVSNEVEIKNDDGNPIPVSGTVTANTGLSQPLTDTQLRASAVAVSGPLTDAELRASVIAVAPNVTRGSGVIDSNTQRVTLATDGATAIAIGSIDSKTPALDNSKQPVIPSMTSGGNISVTTAAIGTNWTAFGSQALKQLTVSNQTGTNIEFRQGGAGVGFIVPVGAIFTFFGITNANQIEARRTDTSNAQVTITSRWEA